MKKIISLALSFLMLFSVMSLAGCGSDSKGDSSADNSKKLKFGMGIYNVIADATNAEGDTNGKAEADHTVAAVLLDGDKIVNCVIDTAAVTAEYTSGGKAVTATEFKTKYEMGDNYGMKAYGGAKKEWYEQVDAFVGVVKGKTIDEVKALVAEGGKGNPDVVGAGCTIAISDFIYALEKAVKNAKESDASADATLKLGIVSTQADATEAKDGTDGVNEIDTTVSAVALKDSKVKAIITDSVAVSFAFDTKGASKTDKTAAISTKREAGDIYGMKAYGKDLNSDGVVKEWYEQADEFDKSCVGKSGEEIAKLAIDTGYGNADLQKAGCTINVNDMVKAAVKAAK